MRISPLTRSKVCVYFRKSRNIGRQEEHGCGMKTCWLLVLRQVSWCENKPRNAAANCLGTPSHSITNPPSSPYENGSNLSKHVRSACVGANCGLTIQVQMTCQSTEGHHSQPRPKSTICSGRVLPRISVPGIPKVGWYFLHANHMPMVSNT